MPLPPGKLVRDIVWTPGRACGLSGGVQKGRRPLGHRCRLRVPGLQLGEARRARSPTPCIAQ